MLVGGKFLAFVEFLKRFNWVLLQIAWILQLSGNWHLKTDFLVWVEIPIKYKLIYERVLKLFENLKSILWIMIRKFKQ